ncbi:ComF family protein [Roseibium denhamense]|nr:ComF family protein [Roseibium denhamense]MTI04521.1 ComF family protein [Roseibium denhamense]
MDTSSGRRIAHPFSKAAGVAAVTARRSFAVILDGLLPPRCICCQNRIADAGRLCAPCWQKMPFLEKPWCYRLGTPFSHDMGEAAWSPKAIADPPEFDRLRAVALYQGPASDLVLSLKYAGRRDLAVPMGHWLARAGAEILSADSLVVPVPLHWFRLWRRRFNQAADLARSVAQQSGASFQPEILRRVRRTRQQVGLSAKQRHANVRAAFKLAKHREADVFGRHIVLIDDVLTTGSTVSACTKVLKAAGAARVDVLAFAHADPSVSRDA